MLHAHSCAKVFLWAREGYDCGFHFYAFFTVLFYGLIRVNDHLSHRFASDYRFSCCTVLAKCLIVVGCSF